MAQLFAQFLTQAGSVIEGRLAEIRRALDVETRAEVSANLLALVARWTPQRLGAAYGQALELAELIGREEIFEEVEGAPAFATISDRPFQEQIEFLRQKRPMPTERWTDALRGDHDRAFVVAGATQIEMVEEFHAAVIAAGETYDRAAFAREFDRIVEKYDWTYNGDRDWRIRTIFETNLRTSYMAGRLRQMRDPDVVRLRPYWQYRHGETRIPMNPRPQHVVWDGLVLMYDDPWWDRHYPPNDWRCSCGVGTLSELGLQRLGKTGPDRAPETFGGLGKGWDYQPGDLWERGLVPSALEETSAPSAPPRQLALIDPPAPLEDLRALAQPFLAEPMAAGLDMQDYVDAFLAPFGGAPGQAVRWEDVTGEQLVISQEMFRTADGGLGFGDRGREVYAPLLAETLLDPDEIWIGLSQRGDQMPTVDRRYIRTDGATGLASVFEIGRKHWHARTFDQLLREAGSDFGGLDALRGGKLVWKRTRAAG